MMISVTINISIVRFGGLYMGEKQDEREIISEVVE